MSALASPLVVELMDGIAAALLASAAAVRARLLNAPLAGAAAIGCIAGLSGQLLRESVLHGPPGTRLVIAALPDDVIIGICAAFFAMYLLKLNNQPLFFWLDNAANSLAGCLGALLGMGELGAVGAISLGLCAGLLPSLIRDVALGDSAMFAEQGWYAASVFIGIITTILIMILIAIWQPLQYIQNVSGELAIFCGALTAFLLRALKGDRQNLA